MMRGRLISGPAITIRRTDIEKRKARPFQLLIFARKQMEACLLNTKMGPAVVRDYLLEFAAVAGHDNIRLFHADMTPDHVSHQLMVAIKDYFQIVEDR